MKGWQTLSVLRDGGKQVALGRVQRSIRCGGLVEGREDHSCCARRAQHIVRGRGRPVAMPGVVRPMTLLTNSPLTSNPATANTKT